jgi:hypothetical protein
MLYATPTLYALAAIAHLEQLDPDPGRLELVPPFK